MVATDRCRACTNQLSNQLLQVREMMYGTGETFTYIHCGACGALSIEQIPENLGAHYPADYYSFKDVRPVADCALIARSKRMRTQIFLRIRRGSALQELLRLPAHVQLLQGLGLNTRSRVCDIGCGNGSSLLALKREGFTNLHGIDPFLAASETTIGGVSLTRQTVDELEGGWDAFTLHHVFEHFPDPRSAICDLAQRLNQGGVIVIRVPLADGQAARKYGADWVQIDAPRHLMVPTVSTMRLLADLANLELHSVAWDSWSFQFWGSEQIRRGIPLRSAMSYSPESGTLGPFSPNEIAAFERRAEELNAAEAGDAGVFVLRRL